MKTIAAPEVTLEGVGAGSMLLVKIGLDRVPPGAMQAGMALSMVDRFGTPITVVQMECLHVSRDQVMFSPKALHAVGARLPSEMYSKRPATDRLWDLRRYLGALL